MTLPDLPADILPRVLEESANGLVVVDPDGRIAFWNRWMVRASGIAADEARGQTLTSLFGDRVAERLLGAVEDALKNGLSAMLSNSLNRSPFPLFSARRGPGGDPEPLEQVALVKSLRTPGGAAHCLIQIQDVTSSVVRETKLQEQARELRILAERIRRDESYLRAVLDNAMDGIVAADAGGVVGACNKAAERIFWRSASEMVGKSLGALIPQLEGSKLGERLGAEGLAAGGAIRFEAGGLRGDDESFPLDVAISQTGLGDERMYVAILRDITRQKAVDRDLRDALAAANDANRVKSEFLATMSHEIRTPMNGVLGMAELLSETDLSDRQRRFAETIRHSGRQLMVIINDILDFSKIESGRIILDEIVFDLHRTLEKAVDLFSSLADERGVTLASTLSEGTPVMVRGDEVRLLQIISNLLSNAIKFTQEGRVDLMADLVESLGARRLVRIRVRDTGIGIDPQHLGRLFEPFTQAESATTRKYGGTGLGLAITRRLVEIMGGEILVRSQPGEGAEFTVLITLEEAHEAPAPETALPETVEIRGLTPPRAPVLVVEDDPVNRQVVLGMLERMGIWPDLAEEGRQAVAMVAETAYALVLMDCQMPEMDGFEATRLIREREKSGAARVPIVALTANAMKGDRERCLAAGMDDYLPKPVTGADLRAALLRWIREPGEREESVVLDAETLNQLREDTGDQFGHIAETFVLLLDRYLGDIQRGAESGDFALSHRSAHSLKGGARQVGAMRLSDFAKQVEAACSDEGACDGVEKLLARLREEAERVKGALRGSAAGSGGAGV